MKFSKKIKNYFYYFKFYYRLKREVLSECRTVLDLGCGKSSPIKFFSNELEHSLGVDNFVPYIKQSKDSRIHSEYLVSDIFMACQKFKDNSFDCTLALDLIEHLSKIDGLKLIKEMTRIASKKVIVYTPNGFLKQEIYDNNIGQLHLSGWSVSELKDLGFKVLGMSGLKCFRNKTGEVKFCPKFIWKKLTSFSQIFTIKFPQAAFQLLCIKKLGKK